MSASKSTSGGTQAASRPSGNTRTQQQAASSNYINTIIGTSRSKPTDSEIKNAIKRVLEVCPDWQEEDILHVLESHNYDSSQAASAILDGSAGQPSQWQDVNKKSLKPAEKGRKEKTGPRRDVQNNGQRREGNFRDNNGVAGPRQPRRDDLAAAGKGPRGPLDKPRGPNVKGPKTYMKGEPVPVAQETVVPATTEITEAPKPALEPLQGVQNAEVLTKSQPTATQAATGKQPLPKQTTQPAATVAPTKPLGGSWSKPPSSIFADKTPAPVVTPVVSEKSTAPSSRLPTATPIEAKTATEPLPSTTLTETKWPTQTSTPAVAPLPATSSVTLPSTTTVAPATSTTPGAVSTTTTTISTAGGVPVTLAPATTPVTPTPATPIEPAVADALPAGRRNEQYYNTSNLLKNQWKPKEGAAATPVASTKTEPVVAAASNPSTSPLLGSTPPTSTSASLLSNSGSSTLSAPSKTISPSQTATTPAKHGVPASAAPSRVAFQSTSPVTLPAHANLSSTYDASHFGQFGSFGAPQTQQPAVVPPATKKAETANTYGDIAIRNRTSQGLNNFESHLHPSVGHEARTSEHNVQNIEGYHDNNAAIGNLDGDNAPTPAPYSYVHPGYMPYPQGYGHYEHDMRYYDGGYPYGQAPGRAGELPTDNKFQGQEGGYDAKYGQESTTQQPGVQNQPQAGQMPVYSYHNAPYYYGSPYHQGYPAAYGVTQPYGRHYYQNSRPYGAPMTYPNSPYNPEEMVTDYKQQQQFMQGSFMPTYGVPTEGLGKGQQGQTPSAGQTGGKNTQSTYTPAPSAPPSGPSSSDLAAFGRNPTQQYKSFASQEQQSFYNVQQQQYGHQGPGAYGYAAPHNYPNSQRNSGQYGNQ